MKNKAIYLDHAAATPVRPEVMAAMLPHFGEKFGNPSSIHRLGVEARRAIGHARESVAKLIGAQAEEIVFTSGATESINLAIFGVAKANQKSGRHIISSTVEHKATLGALKAEEFDVSLVPVDKTGKVSVQDVIDAIKPETILVSLIFVNNETGTINPIAEIARAIEKYRKEHKVSTPYFHVDIAQAVPYLDCQVDKMHVDLASFSAGKMGGPKGVGALYVRRGTAIEPMILGGNQERGLRAGTENVPGIVGFGVAASLTVDNREKEAGRLAELRKLFIDKLTDRIDGVQVNGHLTDVAPHILNVSIQGLEAEEFILRLDAQGIFVSAASACTNVSLRSHVLQAMGLTTEEILSSVRFSFGVEITEDDIALAIPAIALIVEKLRAKR